MKKITALLAGAALLMVAGSSWATSYTWRETIDSDHDRYAGQVNSGNSAYGNQPEKNAGGTKDQKLKRQLHPLISAVFSGFVI